MPALTPPEDSALPNPSLRIPLGVIAVLILTAVIAIAWSHVKLLDQDEIFVLQTDSVRSVRELIHIQRAFPISLDPLVYHLAAHASVQLFGVKAFALHLPSLLGFLLMQLCLFLFIRNLFADRTIGTRAGLFAMTFPALTSTLFYAAEARPYGLLLGFSALCLLAYQTATRKTPTNLSSRPEASQSYREDAAERPLYLSSANAPHKANRPTVALLTLALSIALALNTHYFGVLLLLPLCAAELVRTLQRRKLDIPVLAAIALGMAGIAFALPFQKAAAAFREHYFSLGKVSLRAITQSFRSLFLDYTHAPLALQRIAAIALVAAMAALIIAVTIRLRRSPIPAAEATFLIVFSLLPFTGFAIARFVTHTVEPRYILPALIGLTALLTLALTPVFRTRTRSQIALATLVVATVAVGAFRIQNDRRLTREYFAALHPTAALQAALATSPDPHLYIQDMGFFEVASFYITDPALRSRLALVYSREDELRYAHRDTGALTALHMQHFTPWPIVRFEDLAADPRPHTFLLFHSGWDWTDEALATSHAHITPLGPAMTADAATITFHQP